MYFFFLSILASLLSISPICLFQWEDNFNASQTLKILAAHLLKCVHYFLSPFIDRMLCTMAMQLDNLLSGEEIGFFFCKQIWSKRAGWLSIFVFQTIAQNKKNKPRTSPEKFIRKKRSRLKSKWTFATKSDYESILIIIWGIYTLRMLKRTGAFEKRSREIVLAAHFLLFFRSGSRALFIIRKKMVCAFVWATIIAKTNQRTKQ